MEKTFDVDDPNDHRATYHNPPNPQNTQDFDHHNGQFTQNMQMKLRNDASRLDEKEHDGKASDHQFFKNNTPRTWIIQYPMLGYIIHLLQYIHSFSQYILLINN